MLQWEASRTQRASPNDWMRLFTLMERVNWLQKDTTLLLQGFREFGRELVLEESVDARPREFVSPGFGRLEYR